jgi:carbon starvation protein
MWTLLIAFGAGAAFLVSYHTYGRWLGKKVFNLSADFVCPSHRLRDDKDYVPTAKPIVFGHHFTSIAGTGPIVGPAIAVMWGWLPALLWVVFGSIFIGAVHDFGALVVSLRNNGQTVGDIAGRLLNKRVRLLFLFVLFMALTIVLAIFGLVIAAVFQLYPSAIFPCTIQIPIAVVIGLYLHRKGVGLLLPSIAALAIMYISVLYGDVGWLGAINAWMASWEIITWVIVLLVYSYVASVLPVWTLLQPRDYINSLQLLTALALIVAGLVFAAFNGGAPPVEGATRPDLEIVAPMLDFEPSEAPLIFPFLFITIACGAISGFHCLVSSGTTSKQLRREPDARFVGYGSMLTEGFLATLVILACVAGLGLGIPLKFQGVGSGFAPSASFILPNGKASLLMVSGDEYDIVPWTHGEGEKGSRLDNTPTYSGANGVWIGSHEGEGALVGASAWNTRYESWTSAKGLGAKVGAFVDGAANFLKAMGVPAGIAIALMGVLVASFAGTTLDTACRLQRYVVQELAATFVRRSGPKDCVECGYDLTANVSGKCPECGWEIDPTAIATRNKSGPQVTSNPLTWLTNKHGATIFAIAIAAAMAAMPLSGQAWSLANAGKGGMILWPLFGATNQLLGGLAFMVIGFYLWRRKKPIWFLVLPMLFMLIMPAWAMIWQLFVQGIGMETSWLGAESPNWTLIVIGFATLALEAWMIVEAVLLWPRVRGVLEPGEPTIETMGETQTATGMNC